jgi:hypothetical protein
MPLKARIFADVIIVEAESHSFTRRITMATDADSWFTLFEFQDWIYRSFLVSEPAEQESLQPGAAMKATKWAEGKFLCGQAFNTAEGYTLSGILSFRAGVELTVSCTGICGTGKEPGTFEATGTGTTGPTKGAIYKLVGWVFPELPIANGAAKVLFVRGSVRALRGPDAKPDIELGGMPIGTVGLFEIVKTGKSV